MIAVLPGLTECCQLTLEQRFVAKVKLDQPPQMADGVDIDVSTDHTDQVTVAAGHLDLHAHFGVIRKPDARFERLSGIGVPLSWAVNQQPLKREIV